MSTVEGIEPTSEQKARTQMDISQPIPELEPHCGSWIVTAPDGRVVELYERRNVELAARNGWSVETTLQYLVRINRAIEVRS